MNTVRWTAFRPYDGRLTVHSARLWVIPRFALREVFRTRLALLLFGAGALLPLVFGLLIYMHHNVAALAQLNLDIGNLLDIDAAFFNRLLWLQAILGFGIAVVVAPPLLARDLQNNALPLYLARPISRAEYLLSKVLVLCVPLSLISWVPGLLLFVLQASLAGSGWAGANARIAMAMVAGALAWMVVLSLFALAVSSIVRRTLVARGTMLAVAFVSNGIAAWIHELFDTRWGLLIAPLQLIEAVWTSLFGPEAAGGLIGLESELPASAAWAMLVAVSVACVGVLMWRTRAYEAVR